MEQPLDHHVQQHQHAHHQQQHLSHKNYVVPFFPSEASSHPRQHQPMVDFGAQSNNASMNISNSNNNNNNMSQPSQMQSQNVQYALDMFMNMQGIELPSPSGNAPGMSVSPPNGSNILAHSSISNGAPSDAYSPQLMLEQIRLSQLQHLQQLQQQIFQQQMALITQSSGVLPDATLDFRRDPAPNMGSHGLLTPGPSPINFVSPTMLNPSDVPRHQLPPNLQFQSSRDVNSVPEHIAFQSPVGSLPPPSPDYDVSPLTSPWLDPQQSPYVHMPNKPFNPNPNPTNQNNKRNASPIGDEGNARKRASPAIRPTNPITTRKTKPTRSNPSTPYQRPTRSRKDSVAGEPVGDTPSPVDLSMPPPAPPVGTSNTAGPMLPSSPHRGVPHATPATPASIMNLGRLGTSSSLAPPKSLSQSTSGGKSSEARPKISTKKTTALLISPSPKAIRPAAQPILPNPSLPSPIINGVNDGANLLPGQRKTSHKAAEQKRRDSLKTTFDDLRGLLPPIPLPTDDKNGDEATALPMPILPGALPPRGPPKVGGEGPNKGVSKLQLLMCGNEYIRALKRRVERRDDEIEILRQEVRRLRTLVQDIGGSWEDGINQGLEQLDLERDVDEVEGVHGAWVLGKGMAGPRAGGGLGVVGEEEDEDDCDS